MGEWESANVEILTVGVAGGTGSGKTTLTQAPLAKCAGVSSVLFHDNYYKRQDELTFAEREKVNYDDLDAFDNDLFVDHLEALRSGIAVESPIYDFADHNRAAETTVVEPAPVIIVEGILIFAEPRICGLLDIKLFVDTDADVRLCRAGSNAMSSTGGAPSNPSRSSTSARSSRCTSSTSSPRSATPTSSSPRAGTTSSRWT